jgi:uroporphyrinogen decarboxylase
MRQAGRYLPEYRELRAGHSFEEAMKSPELATEISLQPLRRFPLDAAIVFADIMTPLIGMGVEVEFAPGPRSSPLTVDRVAELDELDPSKVSYVGETISRVRTALEPDVAVVGFAGAPLTLLAYLLEGGGSQHFPAFRSAIHAQDPTPALSRLAVEMRRYLEAQIDAGAQVVQLFDTWAGLLSRSQFTRWVVPAVRETLVGLGVPAVYFAPGGAHLLDLLSEIGATGYGVDWRLPLAEAWRRVGEHVVMQGNLDPALLLADEASVRAGVEDVLAEAEGRPGHIFNLGHGVLPGTPVENVAALVETVMAHDGRAWEPRVEKAAVR